MCRERGLFGHFYLRHELGSLCGSTMFRPCGKDETEFFVDLVAYQRVCYAPDLPLDDGVVEREEHVDVYV